MKKKIIINGKKFSATLLKKRKQSNWWKGKNENINLKDIKYDEFIHLFKNKKIIPNK